MDSSLRSMILGLPRTVKRAIVMVVDAGLAVFGVWIAFYLRLGYFLPVFEERDGLSLIRQLLLPSWFRYPSLSFLGFIGQSFDIPGHQLFWRSPERLPFTGSFLRLYLPLSGWLECREQSDCCSQLCYFCSLPCRALPHGSGLAACMLSDCSRDTDRGR